MYQNYYQNAYGYIPPMQDQLAQLRNNPYNPQPVQGQANMQPTNQPQGVQFQDAQPMNSNMIWVQGEAGAKSYIIAKGNTVPLWDSENQTVYIKSVDASGIPSMKVLDYVERDMTAQKSAQKQAEINLDEYVTRKEFDDLTAKFESLMAASAKQKPASKNAKEVE